ncbi:hypothetical protein H5410_022629 [Solanum commersonii]|uniref:Uncharacterized protein n=1 Tax=Solanum commersonii TaxID=4109 RepID=A0A9J5ZID5_SOLCO|nr:hypothetical protein H5410_022629 [Solanum commersonii]
MGDFTNFSPNFSGFSREEEENGGRGRFAVVGTGNWARLSEERVGCWRNIVAGDNWDGLGIGEKWNGKELGCWVCCTCMLKIVLGC